MSEQTIVGAAILGIVEGLTEYIPVSSTAHILLLGNFLGFESTGKVFEVVIQLGAVLAMLTVYFWRLWDMLVKLPSDRSTQLFVLGILIAFLPAAIIGVMAHGFIKNVLFETPILICVMLIIGGFILLWVDQRKVEPKYTDAAAFPLSVYLKIGLFQCLAMIPGTSRSGATIVGALLSGTDKRSAAEFSFFLAMPTMAGAFVYDLYKNWHILSSDDLPIIATGFLFAFIAAVLVIRKLLDYVSRRGYTLFAYWRIVVGALGLIGLILLG